MRSLILVAGVLGLVLVAPTRADAEPAFLGIGLDNTPSLSGCRAMSITDQSAAAMAGLQTGDAIVSFAGVTIPSCASLLAQIANQAPGDEVAIEVARMGKRRPLTVTLTSRSDVTQRRMVGHKLEVPLIGLGDDYDLDPIVFDRTTIAVVASASCMDCMYVTSKLAHRLRNRSDIRLLAIVTSQFGQGLKDFKDHRYEAPLAVAESRFIDDMLVSDSRAHVMIIDRDGTVVQITPVTQEQSLREFIDELVLVTEQTDRTGRR